MRVGSIVSFKWKFAGLINFQNILDMVIDRDVILAQVSFVYGWMVFLDNLLSL